MEELVYKLNLPPLTDILLPGAAERIFVPDSNSVHRHYDPVELVKPEWLEFNGFKWDFVNFFYKNNHVGFLHSDGPTVWGINWVHGGSGSLQYWRPEDTTTTMDFCAMGHRRFRHESVKPPYLTYDTPPGAYLVNAIVPHVASGFAGRYAFSLRVYKQKAIPWPEVIERFKEYIV